MLVFSLCSIHAASQLSLADQISEAKMISDDPAEQVEALKVLLAASSFKSHPDTLGTVYYALAFRYKALKEDSLAITSGEAALELFDSSGFSGYQVPFLYSWIGESYYNLGNFEKAIFNCQKIINEIPEDRATDVYALGYHTLARVFNDSEDYDLSRRVTGQFLSSSYRQEVPLLHEIAVLLSSSIAHSSFEDEASIQTAKENIIEAQDLYTTNEVVNEIWEELEMQRAYVELVSGNHQLASQINNDRYEELISIKEQWATNVAIDFTANTAHFYSEMGLYEQALDMGRRALSMVETYDDEDSLETKYVINDNVAMAFLGLGNLDSASIYIEKGFELYDSTKIDDSNRRNYLNLLYDKARILMAKGKNDQIYLGEALRLLHQLDALFDIHIQEQLSEYSVANLKALGVKYYNLAIELAGKMEDQETFWYFSEKTKGLLLLRSHVSRRQYDESSIDEKEMDRLRGARIELSSQLESQSNDSIADLLSNIDKRLLNGLLSQSEGQDGLPEPSSIESIQNTLSRNQYVLQYQYGKEHLWLQSVSKVGSQIYNLGDKNEINSLISELRGLIASSKSSNERIKQIAKGICDFVFAPLQLEEGELLIIPDQELFFLPFEVLRNEDGYLIQNFVISYLPSGTFLTIDQKAKSDGSMILYAPEYRQGDKVHGPLKYAKEEVSSILDYYKKGKVYTSIDKTTLIEEIRESQIFHFSGHAISGSDVKRNYLSLGSGVDWEDKIELQEIQNLATKAKLVTLSACDTGAGEILSGEGASSLSRGFLYAGAQSVINTLWEVDDRSTSKILVDFYAKLKEGKSKSDALRDAKLNYINTSESFQRHPYYWAGIIGTGLMVEPISRPIIWWRVAIFFVLLGLLVWFLTWRYSKKPFPKLVFLSDWGDLVGEEIPHRKRKK